MKIAVFQYEKLTGYDTFIFNLTQALTERGHSITVVTSNQFPLIGGRSVLSRSQIKSDLGNSRWIELRFLRIFPTLRSLILLRKILSDSDVVYVKNEILDLIPILIATTAKRSSIVCGIHTPLSYTDWSSVRFWVHNIVYRSAIYSILLSRCDIIHVINLQDKEFLKRILRISPAKVHFLPLWIDAEKYKPEAVHRPKTQFRILFIGELDRRKGVDLLLQSINELFSGNQEEFFRMSFSIVGMGPLVENVKETQARYGNVRHYPLTKGNRTALYNYNDLLVLPSRAETFSYVTLEALSCGLPVIASNIPGPNYLIKDGTTGILLPAGDGNALTQAILEMHNLWLDNDRYSTMRNQCRISVLGDFSFDSIIPRLESLLRRAKAR